MNRVAVWLTNFNNEKHIKQSIESVLNQSYREFVLFIFDNHSTDGAPAIIREYADNNPGRVVAIPMPKGLAGIGAMQFAWDYLNKLDFDFSITLGGHDFWPNQGHLETLVNRADAEAKAGRTVSLIYTDTWQVNDAGETVGRFQNILQQAGQMQAPFIPQWIVSGVDSPQFFGLWVEEQRKKVPVRHQCAGWDHLVVMNVAIYGAILWEPSTPFVMRAPPPGDGLHKYGERHFTPAQRSQGDKDFIKQLEWLNHCVSLVCPDHFHKQALMTSMFATYLCLRGYNLAIFDGALEQFQRDPRVSKLFSLIAVANETIESIVTDVTP